MVGKRGVAEDVYGMALQRLHDRVRAALPEPQCPVVEVHTRRHHVYRRRHREPWVHVSPVVRLARWTMRSERIEGHEWGTYVVLETFLGDGTWDHLQDASLKVTECQ
jgi:hypothetical protein